MRTAVLLFTLTVFGHSSIAATADETMYCAEAGSTGFHKENETYERSSFELNRFTMQVKENEVSVALPQLAPFSLPCTDVFDNPSEISCTRDAWMLNFNLESKEFVFVTGYGFAFSKEDNTTLSIGSCASF